MSNIGVAASGQFSSIGVLTDNCRSSSVLNGKKEWLSIEKDKNGAVSAILFYKNGRLNGRCRFYNYGTLEKTTEFVNDVKEGWSLEYDYKESVVRKILYDKGVEIRRMSKCERMKDYWVTSSNDGVCVCKYNDNNEPIEKGYIFENNHIKKVVVFENGREISMLKSFDGNEMIEYDINGNLIYCGGYADDIMNDYPREGVGKEYWNGQLVYTGEWNNGKRDGWGKTLKYGYSDIEGNWKNGFPHGEGVLRKSGVIIGNGMWDNCKLQLNESEWYDYKTDSIQSKPIKLVIENHEQMNELITNKKKKNSVSELVICERCDEEWKDSIEICGFDRLERIVVKNRSIRAKLLKIADNPLLKEIVTEKVSRVSIPSGNTPFAFDRSVEIKSMIVE